MSLTELGYTLPNLTVRTEPYPYGNRFLLPSHALITPVRIGELRNLSESSRNKRGMAEWCSVLKERLRNLPDLIEAEFRTGQGSTILECSVSTSNREHLAESPIRAVWAPILLEPIPGSGERVAVALMGCNADGDHEFLPLVNPKNRELLTGMEATEDDPKIYKVREAAEELNDEAQRRGISVFPFSSPDAAAKHILDRACAA